MTSNCGGRFGVETLIANLSQAVRLISTQRKVLAQRMTFPIIRQKYAAQIRVPIEDHAEQIVCLALVPVCRTPNCRNGRHMNVVVVQYDFQPQSMMPGGGEEMIVNFKTRLFLRTSIDTAKIRKKIEFQPGRCFQKRA